MLINSLLSYYYCLGGNPFDLFLFFNSGADMSILFLISAQYSEFTKVLYVINSKDSII